MSIVEKLDLRFLQNKKETFFVSVTHLILRFTIVQNKFQQTNKSISMTITSGLRFLYIFGGSGLLWAAGSSAAYVIVPSPLVIAASEMS